MFVRFLTEEEEQERMECEWVKYSLNLSRFFFSLRISKFSLTIPLHKSGRFEFVYKVGMY